MAVRIFSFFGVFFLATLSWAEPSIEKLAKDYQETKKALADKEVRQRQVMSSLFRINKKMKKMVTDQANMIQERLVLESSTKQLAKRILDIEEKLKNQKSLLRDRLTAIYKLGGQGVSRLLFSSTNSAHLERNLKILGIVAKRDLDLIKDYADSKEELQHKKLKFTHRLARMKKIEGRIQEQESHLAEENSEKSKILNDIRRSKEFSLSKLHGLRAKSEELGSNDESGVLDLLFRPAFYEKKGNLPSPVSGKISRGFGVVRDEEHNLSWSYKGVLFTVPQNTPVKSVFDGTVSFVGFVPGFGQTIIVDHGDHYYTVYSNNRAVLVKIGDEIKQNQVISRSGFDSESERDGLYFEVRHFSEPYDPQSWLKGAAL